MMMKSEVFWVSLPLVATLLNFLLASVILSHRTSDAQPVIHDVPLMDDRCVGLNGDDCSSLGLENLLLAEDTLEAASTATLDDDDEEDPMLKTIPGMNFKAYVRADIATFYGEEPGSRVEAKPTFKGQAAKFVNLSPDRVTLYWVADDGTPSFHGNVGPWDTKGTASFPGHRFMFTKPNKPDQPLCEFDVVEGTSIYFCNPYVENDPSNPSHAPYYGELRHLDELKPEGRALYEKHIYNFEFAAIYKNFTGGSEWLTMFPRNPPRHKIWRADYYGQTHNVTSRETQFLTIPEGMKQLSLQGMKHSDGNAYAEHRAPGVLNMTLKALSCAPRAFEIRNFLSEAEADHILDLVNSRTLVRSTTGSGEESTTRTSKTTWLPRHTDAVLNAVIRRAADALRLDEALLRSRTVEEHPELPFKNSLNEDLQIVHYDVGQEYTAHHDFGYDHLEPDSPSRSINLCLYLNDVPAGGTTSFPRWRNAETGRAIHVKPEKTKAMIFYMINPDGNLDDLTQHAANPVIEGEKFFANLWIHDPKRT